MKINTIVWPTPQATAYSLPISNPDALYTPAIAAPSRNKKLILVNFKHLISFINNLNMLTKENKFLITHLIDKLQNQFYPNLAHKQNKNWKHKT